MPASDIERAVRQAIQINMEFCTVDREALEMVIGLLDDDPDLRAALERGGFHRLVRDPERKTIVVQHWLAQRIIDAVWPPSGPEIEQKNRYLS
jgi:hypothetical protein